MEEVSGIGDVGKLVVPLDLAESVRTFNMCIQLKYHFMNLG